MVSSEGDKSPAAGEKTMTDLEQFIKECEALGKRSDNKRGKDKKPRVNSVELKTPKSTDVVVPVDLTKEEIEAVIASVLSLDIRTIADDVMQQLFRALEMQYSFTLNKKSVFKTEE